jgi:predicted esterase YcpF (UPF0227 family)
MVADTRRYHTTPEALIVPTTVLVDKGDELIDFRIAEVVYGERVAMHCFEGGSHTFEHMHEAVEIIKQTHQSLM